MFSLSSNERRYRKAEILSFLQAHYRIHSRASLGILEDQEIMYETTLEDYFDIFDISYQHNSSEYLVNFFNLEISAEQLYPLLYPIHKHTIEDLCVVVERYGVKPSIKQIGSRDGMYNTVSVFQYLIKRLKHQNIDTNSITLSADLVSLVKHNPELVDEILLIAPEAIPLIHRKKTIFIKKLYFEDSLTLKDVIDRMDLSCNQ